MRIHLTILIEKPLKGSLWVTFSDIILTRSTQYSVKRALNIKISYVVENFDELHSLQGVPEMATTVCPK